MLVQTGVIGIDCQGLPRPLVTPSRAYLNNEYFVHPNKYTFRINTCNTSSNLLIRINYAFTLESQHPVILAAHDCGQNQGKAQGQPSSRSSSEEITENNTSTATSKSIEWQKAKKVEKKRAYDAKRILEEERANVEGEQVEMKDVGAAVTKKAATEQAKMDLD